MKTHGNPWESRENYKIDTAKFDLLPNEHLESFWDALWLGIRTFLCLEVCKIVQCRPVPSSPVQSRPVPSRPVPSSPVPSRPVPSRPVQSRPVPSRPVPSSPVPSVLFVNLRLGPAECA